MTLHAPWHSGMAQGMTLALCTRLARHAPDQDWITNAEQIRNSFFASENGPRVTITDSEGLTWLEEYSGDTDPLYVINGHIYAMLGLAQYAQATDDLDVSRLFSQAANTLKSTYTRWRVPGGISYYCASDYCTSNNWAPESYHRGVALLLQTLATITGDTEFRSMGLQLDSDYSV
ncbi:D-glucuronyl C5-epimerase family protein [Actinomyces wuliandei]|uniref:D-glucuronyl C5-epimerase family protein n=1 Tax=Actinomyces wuliandei TaxID=2057743 RepID=UPI00353134BB